MDEAAMAAANLKLNSNRCRSRSRESSSFFGRRLYLKYLLIWIPFSCFFITVGYTFIRYGAVLKVCQERDSQASIDLRLIPSQLVELFYKCLYWSGIQQRSEDPSIKEMNNLCSKTWYHGFYLILTERLPEDLCYFVYGTGDKFKAFYLYSRTVIKEIIIPSLYSEHISVIIILLIIAFVMGLFWKLIRCQKNIPLSDQSSHRSNSFDLKTPVGYNPVNVVKLEETKVPDSCHFSQQRFWVFSFIFQWLMIVIVMAVILSIPWEFLRLYQKAVASHAADVLKGLPPQCTQTSLSWLENIRFLVRWHFSWSHDHDVCQDYYYASMVNPLWEVNPLLVLSSVFTQGMLHPLEIASSSLGRSVRAFFSEIPSQWQPLIMLVAALMIMVLLLMAFKYRLSIPLFLRIEPKTPVRSPAQIANGHQFRNSMDYINYNQYKNGSSLKYDIGMLDVSDDVNDLSMEERERYVQQRVSFPRRIVSPHNASMVSNAGDFSATFSRQTNSKKNEADKVLSNGHSISSRKTYVDVPDKDLYISRDDSIKGTEDVSRDSSFVKQKKSQVTGKRRQNSRKK